MAAKSTEKSANLQDTFLNHIRKQKIPVTAFLLNGVKLQGIVTWFDNFCVLLKRDQYTQLIYKHAISTIMPGKPVQLYSGDDDDDGGEPMPEDISDAPPPAKKAAK